MGSGPLNVFTKYAEVGVSKKRFSDYKEFCKKILGYGGNFLLILLWFKGTMRKKNVRKNGIQAILTLLEIKMRKYRPMMSRYLQVT